jgi:hypothetical protein
MAWALAWAVATADAGPPKNIALSASSVTLFRVGGVLNIDLGTAL